MCVQIMNTCTCILPMDLLQCLGCSELNSSFTCTCTIGLLCAVYCGKGGGEASLVTTARPHVCVKVRSLHLNTLLHAGFFTMYMYSVCICVGLVGELLGGGI